MKTREEIMKKCDIVKIYKMDLVWEREKLLEMTLEEAQEKFKFRLKEEK